MKHFFTPKNIIAVFCFAIASNVMPAQSTKMHVRLNEIMMNSFVSGNAFGVQRNPTIGFSIGDRLVLAAGPTFNRGFQRNTGGIVQARYYLVRDNESYNGHFRLSSSISLQHMNNQSLTKEAIQCEQKMAFNMGNEGGADFCNIRYKGWEAAAGIALSYRFSFGMMLRAEAGLCYYQTDQLTHSQIDSFREDNGTSLRLGVGIGWSFYNRGSFIPPVSEYEETLEEQFAE